MDIGDEQIFISLISRFFVKHIDQMCIGGWYSLRWIWIIQANNYRWKLEYDVFSVDYAIEQFCLVSAFKNGTIINNPKVTTWQVWVPVGKGRRDIFLLDFTYSEKMRVDNNSEYKNMNFKYKNWVYPLPEFRLVDAVGDRRGIRYLLLITLKYVINMPAQRSKRLASELSK